MKKTLFILLMCIGVLAFAAPSTQWFRYAAISPDGQTIAFSHKGDLYLVDSTGGQARPLTFHSAYDFNPVWNKDGSKIAFASDRYGNFDVFVIKVEGGEPLRLTYHSNNEIPYSFTADNKKVIFGASRLDDVKHRQFPRSYLPEVYLVPERGGRVEQLWTIPAEHIDVCSNGKQMVYHDKKGGENYWRKHHTSSVTRDIWKYDAATNQHTQITTFNGEDRNPVYGPDKNSIYYLSEQSGTFNVHKLNLDKPERNQQLTRFTMHPVRFLSIADTGLLCFTHNGDLYTMREKEEPRKLKVSITTARKSNDRQLIPVRGNVREMAISPNGKEIAYIVRGEVFVSAVEGKMNKRITNTAEQERFVGFSADGNAIVYASERNGKWGIFQTRRVNDKEPYFYAATILEEENVIVNQKDNYQPKYSPDGKEIAYIEDKRNLRILNLKSKKTRTLLTRKELYYMGDGDQYFQWSPDSRWLLVGYTPAMGNREVVLLKADGSKPMINLTESGYGDYAPKWVQGGKQVLWLSTRHGLRSYANSGARQMDVYTLFFTKEGWDRFHMTKDEYALWKEIKEKDKKKEKGDSKKKEKGKKAVKKKKVEALTFDWEGLVDRRKRLTIHSSYLSDAVLSKDGETLYYLARFEKGINLWSTKLRTRETKMVMRLGARRGSLQWDKGMKNLYLLANGNISKLDLSKKSKKPIALGGEITFNLSAERQQMFDHVWRKTASMFYISGYHGVDWDALKKNYEPKLSSISNDRDFVELLSEMLGELNVSHCGARYRHVDPKEDQTASLGIFIDYEYSGQGIKIAEVIKNGPLDKNHIRARAGMVIQQINGLPISSRFDPAKYLNRLAGKFTALHMYDPATHKSMDVTVKPITLREESGLLYQRWVKANEKEVDKLSKGKLGYVHIPGMNDGSYRVTYDKAMGKFFDRQGLIVDTRFNGGGDLVGDITMFLTGVRFMTYAIEDRDLGYEPPYRWTKPSVAMVNEANYSDGHCFACAYKDLNIGKIIGMPVPGTCSFAGWEMLQNGRVLWGSVPVSAKNKAGEWLENNPTIPDVQVKNMPGIIDKGRDQQLEAAVRALLEEVNQSR